VGDATLAARPRQQHYTILHCTALHCTALSACSHYLVNVAHAFRDNAARLYGALKETPWAAHAKLVLMTPEGLAPPSFSFDLMRPLTGLEIETWADFTTRLPSQKVGGWAGEMG
jgi:hypothetical protein